MQEYRVEIVENNRKDLERTAKCFQRYGAEHDVSFEVVPYESAELFLVRYGHKKCDFVVMDIDLDGMNGIAAAKELRKNDPSVLLFFVTNMPQYALEGYGVQAFDYIIKPLNYFSFAVKIEKACSLLEQKTAALIRVKTERGVRILPSDEIFYVEVLGHDIIYHTMQGEFGTYGNLGECEKKLSGAAFARCSASMLVNLKYVRGLYGNEVEVHGQRLMMTRTRKKDFLNRLNDYLGE